MVLQGLAQCAQLSTELSKCRRESQEIQEGEEREETATYLHEEEVVMTAILNVTVTPVLTQTLTPT